MALTILAVDDSATMRRVIEMTFAAENVRVVTLENGASAVETALEVRPDVVLADASLDGVDGYAICSRIKGNSTLAHVRVLVMASQHHAYDEQKGRAAGVDDHIIKPFDTQGLIDRVTRLAASAPKGANVAAAPAPVGAVGAPARPAPPPALGMPMPPSTRPQIPLPPSMSAPLPPARSADMPRSQTLKMGSEPPPPMRPNVEITPASRAPHVGAAASAGINAGMAEKLSGLGLTAAQSEAVLALSREVVERVVWEVVPDLAEAIIREELKRLVSE
ncbi:MAG: response regulator [Sandaracinaceae bacterium]|nr:response regulator [Sandaracinaceae bacterium]